MMQRRWTYAPQSLGVAYQEFVYNYINLCDWQLHVYGACRFWPVCFALHCQTQLPAISELEGSFQHALSAVDMTLYASLLTIIKLNSMNNSKGIGGRLYKLGHHNTMSTQSSNVPNGMGNVEAKILE